MKVAVPINWIDLAGRGLWTSWLVQMFLKRLQSMALLFLWSERLSFITEYKVSRSEQHASVDLWLIPGLIGLLQQIKRSHGIKSAMLEGERMLLLPILTFLCFGFPSAGIIISFPLVYVWPLILYILRLASLCGKILLPYLRVFKSNKILVSSASHNGK